MELYLSSLLIVFGDVILLIIMIKVHVLVWSFMTLRQDWSFVLFEIGSILDLVILLYYHHISKFVILKK